MVTGAGGMLGQDLTRAAEQAGHDVARFTHEDLDITQADAVAQAVASESPDVLVNCAAWTDVDGAEDDLRGATDVNAGGAANLAAATAEIGAKLVYPSTDYVFDGSKTEPYVESDEPRPLSVYGQSKLAGEVETAKHNPRHFIVRASWLFGTGGRNFVETMIELGSRQPEVAVVADQVGSPTYTAHVAEGVVRLLAGEAYGLHHMAAGGECSWYDFAVAIFRRVNPSCRVTPTTTDEIGRPAPRPRYSVLATRRGDAIHLPDWRVGLDDYLAER
jgi:dTDP-4-dehydrorhamnose reductase